MTPLKPLPGYHPHSVTQRARRQRLRSSALRVLFSFLLALPIVITSWPAAPTPAVRADDIAQQIERTRSRQQSLQERIGRQKELVDRLKADQLRLKSDLAGTTDKLDSVNADQREVRARVETATRELADVQARYEALVAEIGQLDWTLGVLDDELAQGEQDLEARRRLLAQRLVDAYRTQQTTLLEQMLGSDSFADAVTQFDAQLRFSEQDADLAAQIERDQAALEDLRRLTSSTRYRTEQLRQDARDQGVLIAQQRDELEVARAALDKLEAETKRLQADQLRQFREVAHNNQQAQALLAQQEKSEGRLEQDLQGLIAEQQRRIEEEQRRQEEKRRQEEQRRVAMEQRRRRLAEDRQRGAAAVVQPKSDATPYRAPAPSASSVLRWPLRGLVTQEFGCTGFELEPPRGNCAHFHKGIDISAPAGTPVVASAAGTVVWVGYNPYDPPGDRAWIVTIAHAGGLTTWYAHLSARYASGVRAGAHVARGQVIGYAGNTGRSTGTHLHWEVQRRGQPIDPRSLL